MKMKYANPKHQEELEFIVGLIQKAKYSNAPVPGDLVSNLINLYGSPLQEVVPQNIMHQIWKASLDADRWVGGGWNACEGQHSNFVRAQDYFPAVRKVLLQEFYPGLEGIRSVRAFWQKNKEGEQ